LLFGGSIWLAHLVVKEETAVVQDKDRKEKRKYPRAKVQRLARYRIINGVNSDKVSKTLRGLLLNISGGGILLGVRELTADGLHISFTEGMGEQNRLALEIDLFPDRPPIRAIGKVVWYQKSTGHTDHGFDVGIEFKDISEEDRETVLNFVNRSIL